MNARADNLLTIPAAARELGITESALRHDLSNGAPVARRGRRGRGCKTLVDVRAIEAWRRTRRSSDAADVMRVLATEVPELVADAIAHAFESIESPRKHELAGTLAATWYVVSTALLDRIRCETDDLTELDYVPEKITRLRVIFEASGSVRRTSSP